jgi:hypothetical protein
VKRYQDIKKEWDLYVAGHRSVSQIHYIGTAATSIGTA